MPPLRGGGGGIPAPFYTTGEGRGVVTEHAQYFNSCALSKPDIEQYHILLNVFFYVPKMLFFLMYI